MNKIQILITVPVLLFLAVLAVVCCMCVAEAETVSNPVLEMSQNRAMQDELSSLFDFPVAPQYLCYPGSQVIKSELDWRGYDAMYMYRVPQGEWQGHLWVVVDAGDGWIAIDSYYGVMHDPWYYTADWACSTIEEVDEVNPTIIVLFRKL